MTRNFKTSLIFYVVLQCRKKANLPLDEFGVLQDEPSSHSFEDPNLTDDDFSAKILTTGQFLVLLISALQR